MTNVSMTEARRKFAAIIRRASAGEDFNLFANGYPVGVQIGPLRGRSRGLTADERGQVSVAAVAASGEVEGLVRIIERLTGEVVTPRAVARLGRLAVDVDTGDEI